MFYLSCYKVIKSQEEKPMKTLAILSVLLILALASCKSTYDASAPYDEVYSTTSKPSKGVAVKDVTVQSQPVQSSTAYEGDYYTPNDATGQFDSASYYDYQYSSNIKRFHNDNPGFDYYNDYYIDNYNYDGDPYSIGSSIYGGYGCCGSGLSLSFGLGYGYGYGGYYGYPYYSPFMGYYNPFYDPFYYPYYGWGYGYPGSYWGGYYDGYYNGYWDGYYGGGYYPYPEPYPGNGYYYGPRGSRSGSSDGSNSIGTASRGERTGEEQGNPQSIGESTRGNRLANGIPSTTTAVGSGQKSYDGSIQTATRSVVKESTTPEITPAAGGTATRTAEQSRQAVYSKPAEATRQAQPAGATRQAQPAGATRQAQPAGNGGTLSKDAGTSMSQSRRVQPEMKYEKPKTYTSPSARTTPSKQEYISPATRDNHTFSGQEGEATRRVYTIVPEKRSTSTNGNSTREGGSNTRFSPEAPSHNYSTPTRSGSSSRNSYSAPSSSGSHSSYSAPARSSSGSSGGSATRSGGGGSSSSSSGGSRGGRR